jgi:hypothetical protein
MASMLLLLLLRRLQAAIQTWLDRLGDNTACRQLQQRADEYPCWLSCQYHLPPHDTFHRCAAGCMQVTASRVQLKLQRPC